ncbi:MAG: phage head morphogenesis protein [Clostridiales bacterium]|jgi:hypothetical protein|nr:phage head morphogenesis protein [Clostridiales bacterium]
MSERVLKQQIVFIFQGITGFNPVVGTSSNWYNWVTIIDGRQCKACVDEHGRIRSKPEEWDAKPPLHPRCRCTIVPMETIKSGTATIDNKNGADYHMQLYGKLPEYYISKKAAKSMGWKSRDGNLHVAAPGKQIGGDIYHNKEIKLPASPGRVWYEADINYRKGYRNKHRLLYSNDGLIFVTYDHYETFFEII